MTITKLKVRKKNFALIFNKNKFVNLFTTQIIINLFIFLIFSKAILYEKKNITKSISIRIHCTNILNKKKEIFNDYFSILDKIIIKKYMDNTRFYRFIVHNFKNLALDIQQKMRYY